MIRLLPCNGPLPSRLALADRPLHASDAGLHERAAQVPLRRPAGARHAGAADRRLARAAAAPRAAAGAYPAPVRALLGEMAAAGVLMQANIKFNGALVLQMLRRRPGQAGGGRGAARSELPRHRHRRRRGAGRTRGWKRWSTCTARAAARSRSTRKDKLPGQQPYQGVVPLHGDRASRCSSLAQVLEHYMLQSEQLDTRLVLAADDEVAAGLLIQRLPVEGEGNLAGAAQRRRDRPRRGLQPHRPAGRDADARRAADARCRHHPAPPVLGGDGAPLRAAATPRFACSCSRERVARHAARPGPRRDRRLIAERGQVEVGCDFCGQQYRFDAVDVGELFTPAARPAAVDGYGAVDQRPSAPGATVAARLHRSFPSPCLAFKADSKAGRISANRSSRAAEG